MIRIVAKLFAVTVLLTAFLNVGPLVAAPVVWISSTGSDANPCTAAQPCGSLSSAFEKLDFAGGRVSCLNSPAAPTNSIDFGGTQTLTIDCAGAALASNANDAALTFSGNMVVKIRNLTFTGLPVGSSAILLNGGGTLILENCVFENFSGAALDIEPTGPFNLVVTNSRMSNNGSGVLIKPASGGSVTATFDGVTIAENSGGGVKTDSTNGAINLAISNSTITKNNGNGLNAIGGAGGQNVLELIHNVIASNGTAGIQANGTNAAALVNNTSILNNLTGATSVVAGGRILSYGNNSIVGSAGSGFTGSAALQ
jgi:hypothetical protein